jgi:hypothetical protein
MVLRMDKGVIYTVVAIVGIIIGALAFTYNPGVEVRTQTKTVTTTITESPVTVTAQQAASTTAPHPLAPRRRSSTTNNWPRRAWTRLRSLRATPATR